MDKTKGKCYNYPSLFFKKRWCWFSDSINDTDCDMLNIFSYHKLEAADFKRKERLTTIINLEKKLDDIWLGFRKNFIRKQITRGEKNGIVIKQDNNYKDFKKIYKSFRKEKKIAKDNYKVFINNGILFSAYYQNKMIAGGIYIAFKPYVRAWVLSSLRLDNKLGKEKEIIGQANRMIIWEAIKHFHNLGYKKFDLGGIVPKSKDIRKQGVAEFKEAFGGAREKCFFYYKINSWFLNFLINIKKRFF